MTERIWDPDEWEEHLHRLCRRKHGTANYVEIPDAYVGDYGLEGYSLDGCAYQCYVSEGLISEKTRHERQINKMTIDIGKFISNKRELEKLFGSLKIKRWVLFTPMHTSAPLIAHATKQAQRVLAENLPYVDPADFQVMVWTEKAFADVIRGLEQDRIMQLTLPIQEPQSSQISDWVSGNATGAQKLSWKVQKIAAGNEIRSKLTDELIRYYLVCQDLLNELRQTHPWVFEDIIDTIRGREDHLALSTLLSTHEPNRTVSLEIDELRAKFANRLGELTTDTIEYLTNGTIADWLIRCPLDFPGATQ